MGKIVGFGDFLVRDRHIHIGRFRFPHHHRRGHSAVLHHGAASHAASHASGHAVAREHGGVLNRFGEHDVAKGADRLQTRRFTVEIDEVERVDKRRFRKIGGSF